MKNKTKHLSLILTTLVLTLLFGCQALPKEEVDQRAEVIAKNIIATAQTQPETEMQPSDKKGKGGGIKKEDLAEEQILHLSGKWIDELDPIYVYGFAGMSVVNQIYPGLTRQDVSTLDFLPAMAESWEVSSDELTWTFHLRKNIPWVYFDRDISEVQKSIDAEGNTRFVTAYDFVAGVQRVLDPANESWNAFLLFLIQGAQDFNDGAASKEEVGVSASDEYTLVFKLNKPSSYFDAIAELPVLSAYPSWPIERDEILKDEGLLFMGYGPYVMREWEDDSHFVIIKNPFWLSNDTISEPIINEIFFDLEPKQDVLSAFSNNQIDAVELNNDEYVEAKNDQDIANMISIVPGCCHYHLLFINADMPPFDNRDFRSAISLSIDREKIANEVFNGLAQKADQYLFPGLRAYPGLKNPINFDPQKAKQLFKLFNEAFPSQNEVPDITILSSNSEKFSGIAELISSDLEEVLGVKATVSKYKLGKYYVSLENYKDPAVFIAGYCSDYADAHDFWSLWLPESDYIFTQLSSLFNSQLIELINNAASTEDTDQRKNFYQQAEEIVVNQDVMAIPLIWNKRAVLSRPYVHRTDSMLFEHFDEWAILDH